MFKMRAIKASQVALRLGIPRRTMSDLCLKGVVQSERRGHDYWVTDNRVLKQYRSITPPPDVESVVALAEELGVPRRTACRWAAIGKIEAKRVGRVWRVSRRSFEAKVLENIGLEITG